MYNQSCWFRTQAAFIHACDYFHVAQTQVDQVPADSAVPSCFISKRALLCHQEVGPRWSLLHVGSSEHASFPGSRPTISII